VLIGFTPMIHNYTETREVVELAIRLNADTVNVSEYVPTGRYGTKIALTADQLKETMQSWVQLQKEYAGTMRITWHDCRVALLLPEFSTLPNIGCGAGKNTCRVAADGTLYSCPLLPVPCGNVREYSFQYLWENSEFLLGLRDRSNLKNNCGGCDRKESCGGCRAAAYANYGDAFQGDPECWYRPIESVSEEQRLAGATRLIQISSLVRKRGAVQN
jgi:AdoMet-dependent heme synthase